MKLTKEQATRIQSGFEYRAGVKLSLRDIRQVIDRVLEEAPAVPVESES